MNEDQVIRDASRRGFLSGSAAALASMGLIPSADADAHAPAIADARLAAAATHDAPTRRVVPGGLSPAYSRAVQFGNLVFVAGVVGVKPGTREIPADLEAEIRQTLNNLKAAVEAAGSTLERVLKCTVYLTDSDQFEALNRVYLTFFPKDPPARSTVVVKAMVIPAARLEIDCVTTVDKQ